ncbi:hypothetical protein CP532_0826 [Ophiocordyceps camponoti-leonardi (nom. inval.)]|nr:hypothetical protein CP532_0826 [Ophiocordyceps camponoti-leonardi (nom. inval.)]
MPPGGKKKKRSKKQKKWSLFPDLHDAVTTKLEEEGILLDFNQVDDEVCLKDYDTNIMGRFICRNDKCSKDSWGSKTVAITIRLYRGSSYNARVYYQHCKSCNGISKPVLDSDSYAERVLYRMRIWHDVEVEKPRHQPKKGPPHEEDLCEGC